MGWGVPASVQHLHSETLGLRLIERTEHQISDPRAARPSLDPAGLPGLCLKPWVLMRLCLGLGRQWQYEGCIKA